MKLIRQFISLFGTETQDFTQEECVELLNLTCGKPRGYDEIRVRERIRLALERDLPQVDVSRDELRGIERMLRLAKAEEPQKVAALREKINELLGI